MSLRIKYRYNSEQVLQNSGRIYHQILDTDELCSSLSLCRLRGYLLMSNADHSAVVHNDPPMESLRNILGLPQNIFRNPVIFIKTVRSGISGTVLEKALEEIGSEYVFSKALNTDHTGLNDYCSEEVIDSQKSEIILDTVLVMNRVLHIWESAELANDWLVSKVPALDGEKPADLFDSWEGRRWVLSVAEKIESGEFS